MKIETMIDNGILTSATGMASQFCQIPLCFIKHPLVVEKISSCSSAWGVYALMRNRWNLSFYNQDKFVDEDGKIFFFYAQIDISKELNYSISTVERSFKVLKEIGALVSKRVGFSNVYRLYLTSSETIVKVCEHNHNNSSGTRRDEGSEPAEMKVLNSNNQYSNNQSNNNLSKDSLSLPLSAVATSEKPISKLAPPMGKPGTIHRPLFSSPGRTKTQKNAEKWFKERCTQLNGQGFDRAVEIAFQSFLRSLGESGKSCQQISANAMDIQIQLLHKLDEYPDLQVEVLYHCAGANYRSIDYTVKTTMQRKGIDDFTDTFCSSKIQEEKMKDVGKDRVEF